MTEPMLDDDDDFYGTSDSKQVDVAASVHTAPTAPADISSNEPPKPHSMQQRETPSELDQSMTDHPALAAEPLPSDDNSRSLPEAQPQPQEASSKTDQTVAHDSAPAAEPLLSGHANQFPLESQQSPQNATTLQGMSLTTDQSMADETVPAVEIEPTDANGKFLPDAQSQPQEIPSNPDQTMTDGPPPIVEPLPSESGKKPLPDSQAPPQNAALEAAVAELRQQTLLAPAEAEAALASVPVGDRGAAQVPEGEGAPEFEADSSPYESSSDDSTDSSDSSSDDGGSDDEYQLLDPREQARLLMADAGSDDEGGGRGGGRAPRTQNEQIDEIVEMPDLVITSEMKIEELGNVQVILDNVALIKAKTSGQYQVLESSSVLCLEDRKLIGVVAETIGRVEEPMYVVRFTNPDTLKGFGVEVGRTVFYVPSHSSFLFTKALQVKGSDASNLHDEEIADNEMEFSDDEAEAAYKASVKKQRQARKDARSGGASAARGSGPRENPRQLQDASNGHMELSYDEGPSEDLYTPLSRPNSMLQAPGSQASHHEQNNSWPSRGRGGRGRGRGNRNDRGGNFSNRGRGRGDNQGTNSNRNSHPAQNVHMPPPQPIPGFGPGIEFNHFPHQPPPPMPPAVPGPYANYPGYVYPQPTNLSAFPQFAPAPQMPSAPPQGAPPSEYPWSVNYFPQATGVGLPPASPPPPLDPRFYPHNHPHNQHQY